MFRSASTREFNCVGLAIMAMATFAVPGCDQRQPAAVAGSVPSNEVQRLPDGPSTQMGAGIAPPPGPVGPLDTTAWVAQPPFHAAGDEPYWRLDMADGWFVFQRSGLPDIEAPMAPPVSGAGKDTFDTPPLQVVIQREACETASLSSQVSAKVTFDSTEYTGCIFDGAMAGPGEAVDGVSSGTDVAMIVDALPAIDACLSKLGETAIVTSIYPRGSDRKAMGLKVRSGALYECAVEQTGEIAFLDQVERGEAGAWMTSAMRFLREGQLTSAPCAAAEEVRAGGALVGRMLPDSCKY